MGKTAMTQNIETTKGIQHGKDMADGYLNVIQFGLWD